jgi:hypothetical protein
MMKRFIIMLLIALPMATMAQTQPSELYWLYYTPDSCAYMEREFRYGGYEDSFHYNDETDRRAHMTDEQRAKYDSSCIEYAKTLVFYTKKELERYPVKLKPGDKYNQSRRNRR